MRAPVWSPRGGPEIFAAGARAHRQVIKYAAAERDIAIETLDPSLYRLRHGGRETLFFNHLPDTTSFVAREISNSKPLTKVLLAAAGVAAPEGEVFRRSDAARAWDYARGLGLPVVVKPVAGSGGAGVTPYIADGGHFRLAWKAAGDGGQIVVERHVLGRDHRIFVVGDAAVCAALREPAHVIGDGVSSIAALVEARNAARAGNRYAGAKPLQLSPMILRNLAAQGLDAASAPAAGRTVRLHEIANVGAGGDSIDVTDRMHPDFAAIAVRARQAIPGALHAGVDLIVPDISLPAAGQTYAVCEVNARPDIALHHFPLIGAARDAAGALLEALFPGAAVMPRARWKSVALHLEGKVTGVGLRKHLQSRAALAAVTGWVRNETARSVRAHLGGPPAAVDRLTAELAARPRVTLAATETADEGLEEFEIGS